ncbi:hypothetical protein NE237_014948 [Protea cynaroides]|uniref:Reverse transcriptase RNase H-like domain-containing protein n=1 Tax=Protea cynaroides TaxID=273540 RepID=A0A9Q0QQK2_9MAGN|nr:hypothetical protein NE237_014948 [Protea cynaroides]
MQDGHPISYESYTLNETERRYTVQEKEMTAIVYCLRTWQHYLLGSKFVIKTDNVATNYFQSQKKLSPKQTCWQDFLAEFDMVLEYQLGRINQVVDGLSRKAELASLKLEELITGGDPEDEVKKVFGKGEAEIEAQVEAPITGKENRRRSSTRFVFSKGVKTEPEGRRRRRTR